jgi:hypothetical protein
MNSVQRLTEHPEHPETLRLIHRVYLCVSCYYENDNKQQLFPTDRIARVDFVPEAGCTVFELGIYIYIYIYIYS